MSSHNSEQSLELISVERQPLEAHMERVILYTSGGNINAVLHLAQTDTKGGIVWVGGAGGGLYGPAGGLYPRLSKQLVVEGIASLRLDYRAPNDFVACALDTMIGTAFLETLEATPVLLVGHSFGGAVVITVGALSKEVSGVAALVSQTAGTELAEDLGSRALFLAHGSADGVLPASCSLDIHKRVRGPKDLRLYPNCGHNFDECGTQLEQDLQAWIHEQFPPGS